MKLIIFCSTGATFWIIIDPRPCHDLAPVTVGDGDDALLIFLWMGIEECRERGIRIEVVVVIRVVEGVPPFDRRRIFPRRVEDAELVSTGVLLADRSGGESDDIFTKNAPSDSTNDAEGNCDRPVRFHEKTPVWLYQENTQFYELCQGCLLEFNFKVQHLTKTTSRG